jgi:type I restriction enzyme, S subunit
METKRLGELCTIAKGKKVEVLKNKTEKSIPYLLINTLRGMDPVFFTEDKKYTEAVPSDILIVCDGANSGLVGTGVSGATGSTIARLRINDFSEINKDYFMHFLKSNFAKMNHDIKGAAIPHLKQKEMLDMEIWLPELLVQEKIVEGIEKQFSRLDESEKELKDVERKLSLYKKTVLKKAFHGDSTEFKNIVSKEKHSMKRGPFGGSLKKEIFVPEGYKVYEQKNAIKDDFEIGKYYITNEKFKEMEMFSVKPGDFIISCSGTIGKIAQIPENAPRGIINQALLKITLDQSKILNNYFRYLFISEYIQRHLTNISKGVAIKNVPHMKIMKQIMFPVPSLEDQEEIVQEIEKKFSIISFTGKEINESLKQIERLRKSILKSAFEGKLVKELEVEI